MLRFLISSTFSCFIRIFVLSHRSLPAFFQRPYRFSPNDELDMGSHWGVTRCQKRVPFLCLEHALIMHQTFRAEWLSSVVGWDVSHQYGEQCGLRREAAQSDGSECAVTFRGLKVASLFVCFLIFSLKETHEFYPIHHPSPHSPNTGADNGFISAPYSPVAQWWAETLCCKTR